MICPCLFYISLLLIISIIYIVFIYKNKNYYCSIILNGTFCLLLLICFFIIIKLYKTKESYYSTLPEDEYAINNDRVIAGTVYSSYDVAKEDPGLGWVL